MIVVYTSPGCAGCRKVKQWLKDRKIPFIEKNIFKVLLSEQEIKHLLMRSENGAEDIISRRSKVIIDNHIDIEAMTTDELIEFIQKNPSVLKRPIILDEKSFQVGYDSEEVTLFAHKELDKIVRNYGCDGCSNWDGCGAVHSLPVKENNKE